MPFATAEAKRRYQREYMRTRYQNDPAYRERCKARVAAMHALKRGKLIQQPCEVCGAVEVEMHHDDYSKPLSVRWLCREHHSHQHGGAGFRNIVTEAK